MGSFAVGWEQCRTKQRADLIYRKSLLEETEMPNAQPRPSGGPLPAGSREVTRGGRVGSSESPGFPGSAGLAVGVQPDLSAGDRQG